MTEDTLVSLKLPSGYRARGHDSGPLTETDRRPLLLEQRETALGGLRLTTKAIAPTRIWRASRPGRRHDTGARPGDAFHILIPLAGRVDVVWEHRRTSSGVGDLLVHDLTRMVACDVWPPDDGPAFRATCIAIPKCLLNLPAERLDGLLGRPLSAIEGIGGLLTDLVTNINQTMHHLRPTDGPRLGMTLASLTSALLLRALEEDGVKATSRSHRRALTLRIQGFIQRHLREPDLTPPALAAAHHISTSYLHRLFQEEGLRVTAWIKAQRLERARHDLADPALRHVPIHAIAAGWGFSHPSDFSRAFRRVYGVSASAFRRHALPN
ncbi:helix-turn-helix transcriptional regulator [Nonomuraea sp. B12E4]|uniref:helix-turn-helix transcriptional regulator n=1 Tax=Nonomuraea sp. B12E4 TaxID=3153564 RepID=UPI00325D6A59